MCTRFYTIPILVPNPNNSFLPSAARLETFCAILRVDHGLFITQRHQLGLYAFLLVVDNLLQLLFVLLAALQSH